MKSEEQLKSDALNFLAPGENLKNLLEDLTNSQTDLHREGRRARAKAIFEYQHSLSIAKHSYQTIWATWIIAGATVVNFTLALSHDRFLFQFPNSEVVIREDRLTGKIESKLTDYPWVNGYITNPNLLQTIYQVDQDIKIMEMKEKEKYGKSQLSTPH